MKKFLTGVVLLGGLLSHALQAQKKDYRLGLIFEKKGELMAAIERYQSALYKNGYYAEAKTALERCGNKHINRLLSDYFIQLESQAIEKAEKTAASIADFRDELAYFSIEIELPDYQEARLAEVKELKADQYYQDALKKIESGQLDEAKKMILESEIYNQHPPSEKLLEIIEIKKLENQAFRARSNGQFLSAYLLLSTLDTLHQENKEYRAMLNGLKLNHKMTVGLVNMGDMDGNYSSSIQSAIMAQLIAWSHPLLQVIERDELDVIQSEQKNYFSGLFDQNSMPPPGSLKGLTHLLLIRMEKVSYWKDAEQIKRCSAYTRKKVKVYETGGNWRVKDEYEPSPYVEKLERSGMDGNLHYKLVSIETGEVISAQKVSGSVSSELTHHEFRADPQMLYPVKDGEIVISGDYLNRFRRLLQQPASPKTQDMLYQELERKLSQEVVNQIKISL